MKSDCQELRLYWEEYAEGELPEKLARPVAAHLEGCADCRANYEEVRELVADLRAIPLPEVSERVWEGALARIRSEPQVPRAPRRLRSAWRVGLAAAAALLAVAALGVFWDLARRRPDLPPTLTSVEEVLKPVHGKGGVPGTEPMTVRYYRVEVDLRGRAAAIGQTFDVLRDGQKVAHGEIEEVTGGYARGLAWRQPGRKPQTGDQVVLHQRGETGETPPE